LTEVGANGQLHALARAHALRVALAIAGVALLLVSGTAQAIGKGKRLPDLKVTVVSKPPSPVAPGARFTVRDRVTNVGEARARRSTTRYFVSRDRDRGRDVRLRGRRRVAPLKPDRRSRGRAKVKLPAGTAPGRRYVLVCADGSRRLRERRERNNCRAARKPIVVAEAPGGQETGPPNVLLILTDDQALGETMRFMPETRARFASEGVTYPNAVVTTPLCCPSRASIFSGRYAHNHGILVNDGRPFDVAKTWQRILHGAGYRTGLVGKYLNEVDPLTAPYFDYKRRLGYEDPNASRAALGRVREFLATTEEDDAQPWALVLAPWAPHVPLTETPLYPDPDLGAFAPTPAYGEEDLSDKHPSVQNWATSQWSPDDAPAAYVPYARELEATDELIGALFRHMDELDEGQRTLAFFSSDNGLMRGEHRLKSKMWPYLESVRVPLYVRWPGRLDPGVDHRLAANIDIAPTIFDATGLAPDYPVDGRSLLQPAARSWQFLEYPAMAFGPPSSPPWTAYFTPTRHYIRWADGFVEDYDLAADAAELEASNTPDPAIAGLLDAAAGCAASSCP
jgi:arylsulfatase A-like enzyme